MAQNIENNKRRFSRRAVVVSWIGLLVAIPSIADTAKRTVSGEELHTQQEIQDTAIFVNPETGRDLIFESIGDSSLATQRTDSLPTTTGDSSKNYTRIISTTDNRSDAAIAGVFIGGLVFISGLTLGKNDNSNYKIDQIHALRATNI